VPIFLRFPETEDKRTNEELARLNRLAREKGWRQALESVYGRNDKLVRYVTDERRSSFIDLLQLSPNADVLEIGPGLGQFTGHLAKRARSVYALEVVPGNAEFTAERALQEGFSNVHVAAGGDDCRLPYQDRAFQAVVANLVFEWCASRCVDEPVEAVQRRCLAEIHRVLKPRGLIYLATKNRFALRHLLGKRDEHCYGLRFGSALPRWLGNLLGRLKGQRRPLGMLYSHRGMNALLREAGFATVGTWWAAPEMRYATHYVSTDAASVRRARRTPGFVQGESRSTRLLMSLVPAPLVKHVTPGLAFLGRKS
jgi:SAM-dependent methyltransferase